MRRIIPAILLVAVLAIGGGIIASTAYQAGLSTAVTTATASGGTVVTPVVVPAYNYGYGWAFHPFGWFFGFLATLFFLFIVFALIRAILWRGGRGHRGGWGSGGYGAYGGWSGHGGRGDRGCWDGVGAEPFDDRHRRAHGQTTEPGPTDPPTAPTGVA